VQSWQEKESAQGFVLQMVMESVFWSAAHDGLILSGQTILALGLIASEPWLKILDHAETLPGPMPTDTLDSLLRKLCRIDPVREQKARD
jgi:hypothetical protein